MLKIEKILVPTDFSAGAEKAYPAAQKIASSFGSKVDFIHIIPSFTYINESLKSIGMPLDLEGDVYPKIIDETKHQLFRAMQDYITPVNMGSHFVKIDRTPSAAITRHAVEGNYDLIVMGVKGKHESGIFRGSTTEKVVRNSNVPVLSIDGRMDEHQIKNILVPTDGSMLSFTAFPIAVYLAELFESNITLFHVMEFYGTYPKRLSKDKEKNERKSIYEALIIQLEQYLSKRRLADITIQRSGKSYKDIALLHEENGHRKIVLHTKLEKGISAHYEIENHVEKYADLVVLATHGHSGFRYLTLGSNTEQVVRHVSKPVLTVRHSINKRYLEKTGNSGLD